MKLNSIYDSIEYESGQALKKYKKQLKKINKLTGKYREMSEEDLKQAFTRFLPFNIKNEKHIINVYAIAREVTYRLLGKFQYDVQVLGALAALDRNMIQMSTGSGKTITLILPAVAYGLTHKGVNILTVNDYLSKRDWEETHPVYDWFDLTNAYTSNDFPEHEQRQAFDCDITYSTNSTLGFAYLNSALASDINHDIKIISRPLHAAIIDEVDEILMDDARNPLIIASHKNIGNEFDAVDYNGRLIPVEEIVEKLKHLTFIEYDEETGQTHLNDDSYDEIKKRLDLGEDIFNIEHVKLMHIIHNVVTALYQYKQYTDYVVTVEPDPDSGSRITLIDKATGRLSHGRTLSENLHAFIEMKEGVFNGSSSESSIQVTYQTLFNLFETISGVSGTLGTSFKEFIEIYQTGIVVIPDRLPNKLKQMTHVYLTHEYLEQDIVNLTRVYMNTHQPVLIGGTSDITAEMISDILTRNQIQHKTLVSTDTNEDSVIAEAGKPGSVVVTTDIMGRGTDIHISDIDMERGLVVLQVGSRPNSRVERQFAGRAARQGQPGRYHRMLTVPELKTLGMTKTQIADILSMYREHRDLVDSYNGDILLGGRHQEYDDVVYKIDEVLRGSESAHSQSRVEEFQNYNIIDAIQVSYIEIVDKYRRVMKEAMTTDDYNEIRQIIARLSLPVNKRKNKRLVKKQIELLTDYTDEQVLNKLWNYTQFVINNFIPELRLNGETGINNTKLAQIVRYESTPFNYMSNQVKKFMDEWESKLIIEL